MVVPELAEVQLYATHLASYLAKKVSVRSLYTATMNWEIMMGRLLIHTICPVDKAQNPRSPDSLSPSAIRIPRTKARSSQANTGLAEPLNLFYLFVLLNPQSLSACSVCW